MPTWTETFSGVKIDLGNYTIEPNLILVEDIAHSLSLQCRFNGHTNEFYSVAEHSVYVAELADMYMQRQGNGIADPKILLTALLHDAHEAYLGDVISPVKAVLGTSYSLLEDRINRVIEDRFGIEFLDPETRRIVAGCDLAMLKRERQVLYRASGWSWQLPENKTFDALAEEISLVLRSPDDAENVFKVRFETYQSRLGNY